MGIFGFLSKAHIEQTSVGGEYQAIISQLENSILIEEEKIKRNSEQIDFLLSNSLNRETQLQQQIDNEQERIERILTRIQPLIEEQERTISNSDNVKQQRIAPLQQLITENREEIKNLSEELLQINNSDKSQLLVTLSQQLNNNTDALESINNKLLSLEQLVDQRDRQSIAELQSIIGINETNIDGIYGPNTERIYNLYVSELNNEIEEIKENIESIQLQITNTQADLTQENNRKTFINNRIDQLNVSILENTNQIDELLSQPTAQSENAISQIAEIRQTAQSEIDIINSTIVELRQQISNISGVVDNERISELETQIEKSREQILLLTSEIFSVESQIRLLESEVGPIKYIAEIIYQNSNDSEILEKSVRFVILLLVFVFDPLAIILVIAAISTIEKNRVIPKKPIIRRKRKKKEMPILPEKSISEPVNTETKPSKNEKNNSDINMVIKTKRNPPNVQ